MTIGLWEQVSIVTLGAVICRFTHAEEVQNVEALVKARRENTTATYRTYENQFRVCYRLCSNIICSAPNTMLAYVN